MNATATLTALERRSPLFLTAAGGALIAVVGVLDYLTGEQIAFALFYLIPIAMVTWFVGRRLGLAASVASAGVWLAVDIASGRFYAHPAIYVWNTFISFGFFLVVTLLLAALKNALESEKRLARLDNLTGAANRRRFTELLRAESDRSQRYRRPFTVAYVDLDNFKAVNDRFGHSVGDKVLLATVDRARALLRSTDSIGRLGGDEFAFLLPETGRAAAEGVISKIRAGLLEEMRGNGWEVTFSIGVLTCIHPPGSTDDLIKLADDLMYSVKRSGKNAVTYAVCEAR